MLLIGAVVLVVLVMSVVVFRLLAFQFPVDGAGGVRLWDPKCAQAFCN